MRENLGHQGVQLGELLANLPSQRDQPGGIHYEPAVMLLIHAYAARCHALGLTAKAGKKV
jgi:hypothetical protein